MSRNFKYNVLYMVNFVYSILVDSFLMNLLWFVVISSHNFPYIVSLQLCGSILDLTFGDLYSLIGIPLKRKFFYYFMLLCSKPFM